MRLNFRISAISLASLVLVATASFSLPAFAATAVNTDCTPMALARIISTPDEAKLVTLPGNVHPLARAEYDRGLVPDSLPLEHIIMLLNRTPEQEIALQTRIDQMHNHRDPLFHQWLAPERVGGCYGVANEDIAKVSGWLQSKGFTIDTVPAGRMFLIFSGTAGQVREAFHTEIHNIEVNGEHHIANMSAPQVPAALAPVIGGFRSLHNFFPKPTMHVAGLVKRNPETGKLYLAERSPNSPMVKPLSGGKGSHSDVTYSNGNTWVGPQDFYKIYNENGLLSGTSCGGAACNGAGQTIAVIEETDVCMGQSGTSPNDCAGADDLSAFDSQFGLPSPPSVDYMFGITSYCSDPGVQGPGGTQEEGEADLDLQWASAVAPLANVIFVACAPTGTTAGVDLAAMYAVNSLSSFISSFSVSYGVCEADLPLHTSDTNAFYNALWEQAVAQGQTVVISAGDSGDDTCDRGAQAGTSGWNVNGFGSTPFNVVTGGTDFSDSYSTNFGMLSGGGPYWNTNDTSPYGSALSYVPEMTWNETCGSTLLANFEGLSSEALCNASGNPYTDVNGSGGGGISSIYSLPTWQSVYGVGLASNFTSSSKRNLPDVSLFASSGFWGHALQFCESDAITGTGGGTPCDYSNVADGGMMGAGGTSFVSPQVNGLMALINQRWPSGNPAQSTRQGQADYTLYAMANHEYGTTSAENTSTSAPSVLTCESNYLSISSFSSVFPSCVFYDINRTPIITTTTCEGSTNTNCLQDGNVMPCVTGDTDCLTATGGDAFGLLSTSTSTFQPAWHQSAGYSDAVGLGSFNIANLVNNWTSSTWITPFASTTSVMASPTSIDPTGSTTLTATVTATGRGSLAPPMGTVSFYEVAAGVPPATGVCGSGGTLLGTSALVPASGCTTSCNASAQLMATASQLGGVGSHSVTGCFSGDGANDATSSGGTSVTVALIPTTTTLTSSTNPSTGGQTVTFTATVIPAPSGVTGLGTVKFTANGVTIGTLGLLTADAGTVKLNYSNLKPSGTAYTITATYSGTSDLVGSSSTVMQTVNVEPTTTTLGAMPTSTTYGQSVALTATVSSTNMGTPTGDVIFKNGTASIGTVALVKSGTGMAQAVLNISSLPAAMNSITADYTGSNLMQSSTSTPATTVTVSQATSTTALTSSANPSVYGQPVSFTATVTPEDGGTATGTVTFKKNGVSIGVIDLSGGKAMLPVTTLTPATYMITATYNGSTNVATSTSTAVSQVVGKASTTTVVMSSNLMVTHGTPVTFTATVTASAPSAAVPTGSVMFNYTVNGHSQEMGVGTLSGGQAMLTYTFKTAGSYSVTATYTGSAYVNASPASPAITETVN